jgi:hypothetical protein
VGDRLTNKKLWIAIAVGLWLVALGASDDTCMPAMFSHGIAVEACPDGALRQTARLEVWGARRGAPGSVWLRAVAHYMGDDADAELQAVVPRVTGIELSLLAANEVRKLPIERWERAGGASLAKLVLPEVPDGDYRLRATYETGLGKGEVSVPLALYAPARIHVITDRPLYEPGNTVRFRAVVLRAKDLAPLDHRPGTWVVRDPDNEILLEEAAPAGEWGVVAGSFPLDRNARTGTWKVAWRSADAIDEVEFAVEPFTLPRFRVDAIAGKPFYRAGERPAIKGAVIYSSGAPVAGATLEITWQLGGDWPPPSEWSETLPRRARTGATGRFELALPEIPADLQGRATLTARLSAIDPAGSRATGAALVLLSEDGIQVSAVTELGDGLVESFNNRLYLRVATPDGRVVANRRVTVRRAWEPNDKGISAELDEDGVASLQIDPGAPVNIVIPAKPWRPPPKPAVVSRGEVQELIAGQGAPLADQVELDRWLAALTPCAKWLDRGERGITLGLRVDRAGTPVSVVGGASALERCAVNAVKPRRLPAGPERLYALALRFVDPALPALVASVEGPVAPPAGLSERFAELARSARDCLPSREGRLASMLSWRVRAGAREVELTGWLPDPAAQGAEGGAGLPCVQSRIGARLALDGPAASDAIGLVRFTVALPQDAAQQRPQPTTMLGYELEVVADLDGSPSTRLRVAPGTVPDLRLRVTPVLARPGDKLTAELLRGPTFRGTLPDKLELACLQHRSEAPLDARRRATLAIDPATEGWCTVAGGGVRALVYVRPAAELTVSVVPRRDRYAPGDKAELAIRTLLGGQGGKAAVGLFGVDESLAQLAPLPDGDALGRVRPKVETRSPAFDVLDGQALTLGRIRGANAAAATVLRVSAIPSPPELDAVVNTHGESAFDPIEELTDRFYVVLAELHAQVRAWETKAPLAENMTPATMARLWSAALAACRARGQRVDDAYGRTLRLSRLPPDLLSLTDPRAVVVVATRLTEDVENWPAWVARERP